MSEHRDKLINSFFENMDAAKRSMHGRLRSEGGSELPSPAQIELLVTIRHQQPISFSALAKQLSLTPGAISQLADSLDKEGLLLRDKDPADRRVQLLRLSSKGESNLKSAEKRRRDMLQEIINDLSDEELETWLRIQQKIISRFQQTNTEMTNRKEQA